jgi:exonuclease SbcD
MRLVHTSDWHIGKRFLEVDLLDDQARFCDWLVDVVEQESIEGVLIAGDIFDRAAPKAEAVDLVDDVLNRISALGASIVLISGNHDSAERLGFGSRFMAGAGLYVRTEEREITNVAEPVTLTAKSGASVEILPLPYLDPERVRAIEGYERTHEAVLRAVIDRQRERLINPARSIAMAHAFVAGGKESDSERQLSVGGTGQVSTDLFEDFAYVALGHLHRPQSMNRDRIVYSGSPLAYSFSEQHTKSIRILEVAETITSAELPVDVGRPVITIKDTLDNLLYSAEYGSNTDCFVRAMLTDPDPRLGPSHLPAGRPHGRLRRPVQVP